MIIASSEEEKLLIQRLGGPACAEDSVILTNDYWSGKDFLKQTAPPAYHYYFYYSGRLWDMEQRSEILALQQLLLQKRDYPTAKIYNEFLICVTRIKRSDVWLFYPKEIQIEHTNRCNARCIMCGHFNADKRYCRDLPPQVFQRLEAFLPFCRYVGLHGYGEPFLTRNLEAYLKVYQKYGVRLYTNSNLNYLPDNLLPYIGEMFDEINVSCDSVDPDTYRTIRKGLSLETLKCNVVRLRRECPQVRLRLFVVIMRQNLKELPALVEFAAEYGFHSVVMTEMIAMESNGNYQDASGLYPQTRSHYLKLARQRARDLGIPLSFPREALLPNEPDLKQEALRIQQANAIKRTPAVDSRQNLIYSRQPLPARLESASRHRCQGICDVFFTQMYCSLNGQIAACCVDGYHYIAQVTDFATVEEYWKAPGAVQLRDCFAKGVLPSICNNCNYILVDQLRYLQVTDRDAYLEKVNHREQP